jgi:hypothetical protein
MDRRFTLIASLALVVMGCSGGKSPTAPTSQSGTSTTVTSLSILGPPLLAFPANGWQYITTAQHANLTTSVVTASTTWTSSNTQVAAFTAPGVLSTFRSGTFTIAASYSGRSATMNVSVQ